MRNAILFLTTIVTTVFVGCGGTSNTQEVIDNSMTFKPSTLSETNITSDDIDLVSNSNNDFAFDIYRHFEGEDDNQFISSYSLFSMLNILLSGAHGITKEEMLKAANIDIPENQWFHYFETLNSQIVQFIDNNNSGFHFSFANSFWVQDGIDLNHDYKNNLEKTFGMNVQTVDFAQNSEEARQTINNWTSNMTNNHIEEILSTDSVTENSKIILVNAMYLKALWTKSFFHHDTTQSPFSLLNGDSVSVPLMHQINDFRYVEKNGTQALCMRYKDSDFGLVSFLPPVGKFHEFESNLSNKTLDYFASDFEYKYLDLYYPKFEIDNSLINLNEMLIEKGMATAFSSNADFSGVDDNMNLQLSQIVQKIYFKIDEEGTEAASGTAITIGETSVKEATRVKFDRPFIVMICHIPTRTVLFMGRVLNPLQ